MTREEIIKNKKNLSGANLSSADLKWADLTSADLSFSNLRSAELNRANLQLANLNLADLKWADLTSADLKWANLRSADLQSTDLNFADFQWANLSSANLHSANLQSANLCSANLSSANLHSANLEGMKYDSKTKFPSSSEMLIANWGNVSDELCRLMMKYDMANHPEPEKFVQWASGGKCPYDNCQFQRVAIFSQRKHLSDPDAELKSALELVQMLLKEKCVFVD
jgi:hypothetical protein